ncbi:DUF1876 domain-containing protein [Nocardioides pacificus]
MHTRTWTVEVLIGEDEGCTHAEARLHTGSATSMSGSGLARLNPHDPDVPEIGEELAVSRALSDLAHNLLSATVDDLAALQRDRRGHPG